MSSSRLSAGRRVSGAHRFPQTGISTVNPQRTRFQASCPAHSRHSGRHDNQQCPHHSIEPCSVITSVLRRRCSGGLPLMHCSGADPDRSWGLYPATGVEGGEARSEASDPHPGRAGQDSRGYRPAGSVGGRMARAPARGPHPTTCTVPWESHGSVEHRSSATSRESRARLIGDGKRSPNLQHLRHAR